MKKLLISIKKIMNKLSGDNGFTLIEAVVTVAIVGIVVTPIAMIFQGVLMDTIETKDQLKATQLAQQYVESFRVMSYEDLVAINDGGVVNDTVLSAYNLPAMLPGMSINMSLVYDMSDAEFVSAFGTDNQVATAADNYSHNYQLPSLSEIGVDYDVLFYMNHLDNNQVFLYHRDADFGARIVTEKFPNSGPPEGTPDRAKVVDVFYSNSGVGNASVNVDYTDGSSNNDWTNTYNNASFVVAIFCDADDDPSDGSIESTVFNITNHSDEVVQVYVYRTAADNIAPTINQVDGDSVIFTDLETTSMNSHRIYELEVEVLHNGQVLSEVSTTVIAK